ncbi:MAG: sugar transferase, partial [Deltaproteobacteria bacterium]|nr:sugar transferase [Deltaproteobacteria bacterium]
LYFMEGGDYSLVGFLDDSIRPGTKLSLKRTRSKGAAFTAIVLGGLKELGHIVKQHNIYQVMIAMPSVAQERILQIIDTCIREKVRYGFVPHLYSLRLEQIDTKNIGDIPLLKKRDTHLSFLYVAAKRLFDIAVSFTILAFLSFFFPFFALMVKLGSRGPIFFRQKRVGKDGKLFAMYKFRTMAVETPVYMPSPSSNEPSKYINKFGSFLRDTNLDEIPQLWNVLKGDMSIVGPRPEMSFHVEKYDEVQRDRLKVQPGLTGLWQISPDRDKEIHDNIDYDLYYINNQSFFLDLVLVLETFLLTCAEVGKKMKKIRCWGRRVKKREALPVAENKLNKQVLAN